MTSLTVDTTGLEKKNYGSARNNNGAQNNGNPQFTGAMDAAVTVLKTFNDQPMIGVAFTDTVATNIPRTVVDLKATGPAGGFETLRREFSGLAVNCLMPSFFVLGAARLINGHYMKDFKGVNMSGSWANSETIDTLKDIYKGVLKDGAHLKNAPDARAQAETFVRRTLGNLEGLKEKNWVSFADKLDTENGKKAVDMLSNAIANPYMPKKETKQALKNAIKLLAGETEAVETIRFKDAGKIFGSNLSDLLRDQIDLGRKFSASSVRGNLDKFAEAAKKMVNTKSVMGLAIVIPLAMSMQYINRAITRHKYKKTGAPIYKDFEKEDRVLTPEEQKKLSRTKPFCVASMVGLALLSMMKKPSLEMFQFKGMFPTVDQCRWIATSTFSSRMITSEDPNELRETTVRDIASFSGLYFLGDYASKACATLIEKVTGTKLLNHVKEAPAGANVLQKFGNWVKNVKVKSFDEVANSAKATRYRGVCELASLGFSILTLGILLPIYNKRVTARKEAERKANMQKEQAKIQQMAIQNNGVPYPAQAQNYAQNTMPNRAQNLFNNGVQGVTNAIQPKKPITPQTMIIHPMKDTSIGGKNNVSILNGVKVKDLEVTSFDVRKAATPGAYDFEMKGKFKDWEEYTKDDVFKLVATECFR